MHANQGLGGNGFLYWCEFASIRGFILKLGILANRDMVRL
jgi:hypothetical protein